MKILEAKIRLQAAWNNHKGLWPRQPVYMHAAVNFIILYLDPGDWSCSQVF